MEYVTLNNGVKMPQVGLGTYLIPQDKVVETIGKAYEMGYRSFDTAWRYHNEGLIAKALKEFNIPREDVFITTKVNVDALYWKSVPDCCNISKWNMRRRTVRQAIEDSFINLGLEYIDMFMIHYPYKNFPKMWKVLSEIYHQGRVRAIGVCSFLPPHLDYLKDVSDVIPAVNQFEISPLNTQKKLIAYCQENGIAPQAMSTFSHFRSNEPRLEILNNPILLDVAEKHSKSVVQVVLRWLLQQKVIIIPKTWDVTQLKENISLFDFELNEEEMSAIDSLDEGVFLNYDLHHTLVNVPYTYNRWPQFLTY